MAKPVEYNRSDNAKRRFTVLERRWQMGKSRIFIECPFCGTRFWAYLWSLAGGGKKCENKKCGAKHSSWGDAFPVVGRENLFDE